MKKNFDHRPLASGNEFKLAPTPNLLAYGLRNLRTNCVAFVISVTVPHSFGQSVRTIMISLNPGNTIL